MFFDFLQFLPFYILASVLVKWIAIQLSGSSLGNAFAFIG